MIRLSALLASCTLLSGCIITKALWREDPVSPEVVTVTTNCDVHGVTMAADAEEIGVTFSVAAGANTPRHLLRYTPDHLGYLALRPPVLGGWLEIPGSEIFQPQWWEFRVTRGSYFLQPTANARVVFHGTLPRPDVGVLVERDQLPADLPEDPQLSGHSGTRFWVDRCIEAFEQTNWVELLDHHPAYPFRPHAVAWLDADMRPPRLPKVPEFPTHAQLTEFNDALSRCFLVGRLDNDFGETRWVRVPDAILLQGPALRFAPDGELLQWARSQIWDAEIANEMPDTAAARSFELPLANPRFDYRWMYEVPPDRTLSTAARVILTPIAAALDIVVMTNPYLAHAMQELFGKPRAAEKPTTQRR